MSEKKQNIKTEEKTLPWINPIGSLGNALMLSGVLKMINETDSNKKYNIVRRSKYQTIFKNHPAVNEIGHPDKESEIIEIDFWFDQQLNGQNAFQTLASKLGLKNPVEEKLYIPEIKSKENLLLESIPWKEKNIVISISSPSMRKMMNPGVWMQLVNMLKNENFFIIQVGTERDIYLKNTYSLLGVTDTRQLISVINRADAVITIDNFIMHAAKLVEKPTVVIWGPTRADKYGYKSQENIHGEIDHCPHKNECLGFKFPENYRKPCPLQRNEHCMNKLNIQQVFNSIINQLNH
jgi:ADP-heptose:LPS heptosyltransferase